MIHDPNSRYAIESGVVDVGAQERAHEYVKPSLVATLTGTALVSIDRDASGVPFSKDISLELVFGGDHTQISINPIDIVTVTGVRVVSDGGTGVFCRLSGLMEIPLHVRAGKNGITLNLGFTLSTEVGEMRGPFTPCGARLETDGSVTLAAAAFDSVFGIGVNVLLVISGTVQPLP